MQRLPGDLDKNIDEILAEVDKDKNGEVDYEEVRSPACAKNLDMSYLLWHGQASFAPPA